MRGVLGGVLLPVVIFERSIHHKFYGFIFWLRESRIGRWWAPRRIPFSPAPALPGR